MKSGNPIIKANNIDWEYVPQTRSHKIVLPTFGKREVYLKREDETGFAITGGKLRKYASILPWLKAQKYSEVGLIGSSNSNHLVSAAQLLIENGLRVIPFVKKNHTEGSNQQLLEILVERAYWQEIDGADWGNVEELAIKWVDLGEKSGIQRSFLPEGAFVSAALPGALTLANDIARNEQAHAVKFEHIFIDAGTCMTAIGLALGLSKTSFEGKLHIVSMAETEAGFWTRWNCVMEWLATTERLECTRFVAKMKIHRPISGPKFGATNATVRAAILRYARELGILTDPIYSAKHLMTCEHIIAQLPENEPCLIIHGGGAQSLLGFLPLE